MANIPPSDSSTDAPLTAEEISQLQAALLAAMMRLDELEAIVSKAFGPVDLIEITVGNLTSGTLDVIRWADARRKIPQLIQAALEVIPGNPELQQFEEYWKNRPPPAVNLPQPIGVATGSARRPASPRLETDSQGEPAGSATRQRVLTCSIIVGLALILPLGGWFLANRPGAVELHPTPQAAAVITEHPTRATPLPPTPSPLPMEPTATQQLIATPAENSGLLAYAADVGMNGEAQWDLFVYDFAARRSTEFTRSVGIDETAPAWSHAGGRLAYVAEPAGGSPQVWMMGRDQSDPHAVTAFTGGEIIWYVAWSADDRNLIITVDDGDEARLVTVPSSGRDVDLLREIVPKPASHATVSTNSEMVYVTVGGNHLNLVLATETGDNARVIAGSITDEDMPSISADGGRVAFNVGILGSRRITVLQLKDGVRTELPPNGADDSNPVWSPDGESLAIVVDDRAIWIVPLDGGASHELDLASAVPMNELWYLSWTGEAHAS